MRPKWLGLLLIVDILGNAALAFIDRFPRFRITLLHAANASLLVEMYFSLLRKEVMSSSLICVDPH